MKVLVLGEGGKEHSIVWKLSQSKHVDKIYCSPGNAGIADLAECIEISPKNLGAFIDFIKYEWIDLTIVGSEELLSKGIVNALDREGCRVLGPDKTAARIRASRAFTKNLMRLHGIPIPEYKVFTSYLHAQDYVRLKGTPIIIKADCSFIENSVFLAFTEEEAIHVLGKIMKEKILGDAGNQVILEEHLEGEQITFIAVTDGKGFFPFTNLYKYIRISNGNRGSCTSGVGAYSPVPLIPKEQEHIIMEKIIRPIMKALSAENMPCKGIISMDLILAKGSYYLSEINCSMGDLEAQTVLPRLRTDFMDIVLAIIEERLSDIHIEWNKTASVCIIVFSEGYPGKYQNGVIIEGLEKLKGMNDTFLFHNSTSFSNGDIVNTGGRVFGITAVGTTINDARIKAYTEVEKIYFDGMYYRKDIGM